MAAVRSDAVGPAWDLALACDLRVAAAEARLGSPEIRWGRIPSAGATQRLARIAGLVILETLVFSTWYAGRYLHTPRLSLGKTAAVGLIAGVGWCVYGLWRDRGQRRRLTGPGPDV